MKIRDDIRLVLADEFEFALSKMRELPSLPDFGQVLFYYSAFAGALNRALNLQWNRDLALLHFVMQFSYNEINIAVDLGRLHLIDDTLHQHLLEVCKNISQLFRDDLVTPETLYPLVARITELSYSTTGNGRYNLQKGNLVL